MNFKAEERVARILAATEALLTDHDPEELTLTQIANAAGLKRTLVYHSFPSKNDIFEAIASRYYDKLKQRCIDYFDPRLED